MKFNLAILVILSGMIFISCDNEGQTSDNDVQFIHTVFFWLNESATIADRAEFEEGLVTLGTVPSIMKYYYGKPAGTPRLVVDNSYDYAWIVHFPDAESQDEYQEDPIHQEFVEKYNHLWKEVKVFDTILEE